MYAGQYCRSGKFNKKLNSLGGDDGSYSDDVQDYFGELIQILLYQGHSYKDIEKYSLGKIGVLVKYAIKNEKLKHQTEEYRRLNDMYDMRLVYHADTKEFEKQIKRFKNIVDKKPADSAGAAKEILAKGIAHGRRRKTR